MSQLPLSRSTPAMAFDFDVVTDSPAPRPRPPAAKPDPQPATPVGGMAAGGTEAEPRRVGQPGERVA
jgi:hypothetical protein